MKTMTMPWVGMGDIDFDLSSCLSFFNSSCSLTGVSDGDEHTDGNGDDGHMMMNTHTKMTWTQIHTCRTTYTSLKKYVQKHNIDKTISEALVDSELSKFSGKLVAMIVC